jgi:two-component sensor histidine kinase
MVMAGPRMSARKILSLALVAAGVLPLVVFSALFWPILRGHLDADIAATSRSMLAAVQVQIETSVFIRPRSVLPTLLALARESAVPLEYLLEAFSDARPEYAALLFVDAEGRIEAAQRAEGVAEGLRYSFRAERVPEELAVSLPFSEGGKLCIELSLAEARRTVVGIVDLGEVSSRLILAKRLSSDRVGVVDSAGRFILCSDVERLHLGVALDRRAFAAGSLARVEDDGTAFYASSLPVPGSDWFAVYLSPVEDAEAPLRSFFQVMIAVLALSAAGSACVALLLRRAVAGPLDHLVTRIGMIAAGRYDERVAANPLAEFEVIGRAVNAMADSIQRRDRDLKRDEERMTAALRDKTLLLKEVYHRVKNNLQIISSLLSMQANESADKEVAAALRDGQDRVYAMSLVHEFVYQMSDLSSIETAEYAARLTIHLAESFSYPRERISLDLTGLNLGLERAIPFGLALNEMLTNAFKYAGGGDIRVSLDLTGRTEGETTLATLTVADEGPGMLKEQTDGLSSHLGLSLIQGLAEQLGGSASWTAGPGGKGTAVAISFALGPEEGIAAPLAAAAT